MSTTVNIEPGRATVTLRTSHEILWSKFPFFAFDGQWREIKTKQYGQLRSRDKTCFFCRDEFEDGQQMGLVCLKGSGNQLCCEDCHTEIKESAEES